MWQENSPELPKPCIVIVHTSKRSAIRLFAKKGSNIFDNVVAGTIIDDGITSDSIFDFELVANNTKRVPLCRSCVHCNPHAKSAAKLARACRLVCLRTTRCCAFAATSKRAFSTPISLKVHVPPLKTRLHLHVRHPNITPTGVCDKDWITKLTFALSHLYFCYIRGSCRLPNVLTWANR